MTWWLSALTFVFAEPLIYSETQDIENYMKIGSVEKDCKIIPILFPEEVPAHALGESGSFLPDTTRYYNITEFPWGPRYELFAQWQLSNRELESEKARLEQNFSDMNRYIVENEDWVCWVFAKHSGDYTNSQVTRLKQVMNGTQVTVWEDYAEDYHYDCFAFRPRDGVVRYISSYSSDGGGTPFFTQLDWN